MDMESTRIIFLDIDGVLIINGTFGFDQTCMENLQRIVKETKAKIVLSTSWRLFPQSRERANTKLEEFGMRSIGFTPTLQENRSVEILQWLKGHPVTNWIAIDDMNLSYNEGMEGHFVLIKDTQGLTSSDADQAIKLLLAS